mmetsp:Transcript_12347/g.29568  ORF Transcript_12347/g.29568 Transcript_12347/m.29568 type:complete len:224 (-) Transcript_12347:513-1184(-)
MLALRLSMHAVLMPVLRLSLRSCAFASETESLTAGIGHGESVSRRGMRHRSCSDSGHRSRLRSFAVAPMRNSTRSRSSVSAGSTRSMNSSALLLCGSGRPSNGSVQTTLGSGLRSGLSSNKNAFSTGRPRLLIVAFTSFVVEVTTNGGFESSSSSLTIASLAARVLSNAFLTSMASSSSSSFPEYERKISSAEEIYGGKQSCPFWFHSALYCKGIVTSRKQER